MNAGTPTEVIDFFPPPAAAAALYIGKVMHQRFKPLSHRFNYRVYALLIDLDRLVEADTLCRFFSVARFNLLSFWPGDHGNTGIKSDGDTMPLRDQIADALVLAGIAERPKRILFMCYPRVLGTAFNPIAVYFAYGEADRLIGLVYEVRNTFGEKHSYVPPIRAGEINEAGVRQQRDKRFYVSPFNDLDQRYYFRVQPPTDTLAVRILQKDQQGPLLAATFYGEHKTLTNATVLRALVRVPLLTITVVAGIHWEALKLWLKGLRLKSRPAPPEAMSFGDGRDA